MRGPPGPWPHQSCLTSQLSSYTCICISITYLVHTFIYRSAISGWSCPFPRSLCLHVKGFSLASSYPCFALGSIASEPPRQASSTAHARLKRGNASNRLTTDQNLCCVSAGNMRELPRPIAPSIGRIQRQPGREARQRQPSVGHVSRHDSSRDGREAY